MDVTASFVIPAFNEERNIGRCIDSIRRLDCGGSKIEIIVIDNGSRDQTAEIARRNADVVDVHPGRSVSWLRNHGARMARGKYLAFVDADCEVLPDWLTRCLAALERSGPGSAVGNFYTLPPGATWVQRAWGSVKQQRESAVTFLPAGNFFVSRDLFTELGGFNEALVSGEDYDFFLRLRARAGTVLLDPRIISLHHEKRPTLRGTIRKEYWYGKGMAETFRQGEISRPFILCIVNAILVLAGIAVAALWHEWLVAIPLVLAVPVMSAVFTCARSRNFRYFFHLIPIYAAYMIGRFGAVIWLLRQSPAKGTIKVPV
jgi:glycosyltransferase involved in cell wall biosynthesis